MSGVRATAKGVSTTVDLMAGMGLKYVHATSKGRKGQMGDLEKSREQVRAILGLCMYTYKYVYLYLQYLFLI